MAVLNLKQITDKLNGEFVGEERKLVFWYDAKAEFKDDIDSLELNNAKIWHLEPDNQFYTKYYLEREDTKTNYLVYAPFAKPAINENHLEDTIRYSKEFHADRASLITVDLGIDERYKPVIQHYISFFASKERTQKFYDLEIENFNRSTIEVALLSVLCNNKTASFYEVLRCVLTDAELEDNKFLAEFEKYDLINAFWQQVDIEFGYSDPKPTLLKLLMTMFITYTTKCIHEDLPDSWKSFISYKSGTAVVFLDNIMNSLLYSQKFDELSEIIYKEVNGEVVFNNFEVGNIIDCALFKGIDQKIISWMIERLENEDIGAKAKDKFIPEICSLRRKMHFGNLFESQYYAIENAYHIIAEGKYESVSGIKNVIKNYISENYKIDMRYRYFYYHYDKIENTTKFEKLRDLVENIYTNDYLNKITVNWNNELDIDDTGLSLQRDFYSNNILSAKDRVVVIISDALRYEAAHTLFEKFQSDEKCHSSIAAMQGVLPSYTPLGMASLLPHRTLEYNDKYEVLVDGKSCATTLERQAILQSYKSNSRCVQFDLIKDMKQTELRTVFTGQEVVYIYHNQVDSHGDAAKTENEVFTACEDAVNEIYTLIKRIASMANTQHFLITADHGFIYKRDRLSSSDKITSDANKSNTFGQRYAVSENSVAADGVKSISLGKILGNSDYRVVSFPLGSDIFKVSGAGQNFVHGGSSPQEMLVPLVDVKVEKGRKETTNAELSLVSLTNKITNLITTLDFVQSEPVSDIVKKTTYRIYFITEDNEKISNEVLCIADKKDNDTLKRMFRLKFNFKNRQYDRNAKYYLVVYDEISSMEIYRKQMIIDIAFADDFGFF